MKTLLTRQLFVIALLFFAFTKSVNAQNNGVSFELLQQPCNNDGVLVIHITGSPPIPFYISIGMQEMYVTFSSSAYTIFNYNGAPVYAADAAGIGYYGYYNGAPPFTYSATTTPAVCPNLGTADVTITGGLAPFTIEWFDESGTTLLATGTPADLPAGFFTVLITDANGCVNGSYAGGDSLYIYNDSPVTFTTSSTMASCTNGTASVSSPSGGIAPYTYLWSNGANTPTISGLIQGSYTVTVTDAQGCFNEGYAYVQQTPQISVNTTVTPATCLESDGAVWAFGSGGVNPYTYLWSDGQTNQQATGLSAGYYQVTATDANGCISYQGWAVVNSATPITVTYTATASLCTAATGTATVTPAGGTPPYTVDWNTFPAQTGTTASNLSAGNYFFNVTDAVGCVRSGTVNVPPVSVVTASASDSDVMCNASNGTASVNVTSGSAPYTYLWNTGATTTSINGLAAGGYSCVITDSQGCSVTKSTYVASISPIGIGFSNTPASCIYTNDGTATVSAWGGTPPYTYHWSTGATTTTISGLADGYYYVSVQDAAGCWQSGHTIVGYNTANNSCYCTIRGTVYNDLNTNCTQDIGEAGIENIMITSSGFGGAFTDANGDYAFIVPSGTYTISENIEAFYPLSPCQNNANVVTVVASSGCTQTVDFGNTITPIHSISLFTVNTSIPPVVGNTYYQNFIVRNDGTVPEAAIELGYEHDGQLGFVSANPSLFTQLNPGPEPDWYSIVTGFPTLNPASTQSFSMQYNVPTNIPMGTTVLFNDTAVYQAPMADWINDYTPWNNVNALYTNVVASYDPNNKEVSPVGLGDEGRITTNDSILTYTIHFQNTGTWTAQNIYLLDTLDSDLNLETLRPVYSSHPCVTTFTENGVVKFAFDNINLPDSGSNFLGSMGMVIYTIHLNPDLDEFTEITNAADIFFDYNAPVRTNSTLNTIVKFVGIEELVQQPGIGLYPNPAQSSVVVVMENNGAAFNSQLNVLNLLGESVLKQNTTLKSGKNTFTLDISSLAQGIYVVELAGENYSSSKKLVVVK